jgi:hypothetical protein
MNLFKLKDFINPVKDSFSVNKEKNEKSHSELISIINDAPAPTEDQLPLKLGFRIGNIWQHRNEDNDFDSECSDT